MTQSLRVLLVEDDADIAAGLAEYLCHSGIDVDFAYTATQAFERVRKNAFDLFVLDVNLPGMDGITLCRELKQRGHAQPAIFLTARGALDDKLRGFAAGGIDWMVKPFAPQELVARVRALTAHHTAREGATTWRAGEYELDVEGAVLRYRGHALSLHSSAVAILQKLMSAAPAAVSRQQLEAALWSHHAPGTDALRAQVYLLRQALRSAFDTNPVATERGLGWRFEVDR